MSSLLSVKETSNQLGVSAYYVKKLIAEGQLQAHTIGSRKFVVADSVLAYTASQEAVPDEVVEAEPVLTYIYGLHAGDGAYRYIGRTIDPKTRISMHRSEARAGRDTTAKGDWIREVGPQNIELDLLDSFEEGADTIASVVEAEYIEAYQKKGFELLNSENRPHGSGSLRVEKEPKRYLKGHHTMFHYRGRVDGCEWCTNS